MTSLIESKLSVKNHLAALLLFTFVMTGNAFAQITVPYYQDFESYNDVVTNVRYVPEGWTISNNYIGASKYAGLWYQSYYQSMYDGYVSLILPGNNNVSNYAIMPAINTGNMADLMISFDAGFYLEDPAQHSTVEVGVMIDPEAGFEADNYELIESVSSFTGKNGRVVVSFENITLTEARHIVITYKSTYTSTNGNYALIYIDNIAIEYNGITACLCDLEANTITLDSETGTVSYQPFYNWMYAKSQQIYPAELFADLEATVYLKSIAFYVINYCDYPFDLTVSVGVTNKTNFEGTNSQYYINTGLTRVYHNANYSLTSHSGWETIEFEVPIPYTYSENSNIVIDIVKKGASGFTGKFSSNTTYSNDRALRSGVGTSADAMMNYNLYRDYVPNCKFVFCAELCQAPHNLTADWNCDEYGGVQLSWNIPPDITNPTFEIFCDNVQVATTEENATSYVHNPETGTHNYTVRTKTSYCESEFATAESITGENCNTSSLPMVKGAYPCVEVYPNPFHNDVTLRLENFENQQVDVEIFDVLGNKISVEKVSSPLNDYEKVLNLDNLSPAVYDIVISTRDFVIVKQIVKQ